MLKEGQHWATSYAVSAEDLYIKFPSKKYISLYGEWDRFQLKALYAKIMRYFFYIVVKDVIENGAILKFPPGVGAFLEMTSVSGDDFIKARQNGAFQDVDFLASNFTGYHLLLRFQNRYGKWTKKLYISAKYRDYIIELTNLGKCLIGGKIKQVANYVEKVQQQFPILSKSEINKIITFGLKRYAYVNRQHCDVLFSNRTEEALTMFCGRLTMDSLKHYYQWHTKWRLKERMLYHLKKKEWDGYYYIGLNEEQHLALLKLRKTKHLRDVYLVKVQNEFRHQHYIKHVWRIPYIEDCGWKFYRNKIDSDKLEYVGINDYAKYHQCFLRRSDDGLTSADDASTVHD